MVKMSDVTVYLENIERNSNWYFIPGGIFSTKQPDRMMQKIEMDNGGYLRLCAIIRRGLSNSPDALTVDDAAAATEYSRTLILERFKAGICMSKGSSPII